MVSPRHLLEREVHHGLRLLLQQLIADVADDADHRPCRAAVPAERDLLTHRIHPGPDPPSHRFRDHDHPRRLLAVGLGDQSSLLEWDANGGEVPRRHRAPVRRQELVGARRLAADHREPDRGAPAAERRDVGEADRTDARRGREPPRRLGIKRRALVALAVALIGERQRRGEYAVGAEPVVDPHQPLEAPPDEPGADEKDERERDRGDDEDAAKPAGGGDAPTAPQHVVEVCARRLKRGRDPEQDAGNDRGDDAEGDHPPIDRELVEPRDRRRAHVAQDGDGHDRQGDA